MYDGIFTKYEEAKELITHKNARDIANFLEKEIEQGNCPAQNYAFLSKAYFYLGEFKESLKYAKLSVKQKSDYAYGYARIAYVWAELQEEKRALRYARKAEKLGKENVYILFLIELAFNKLGLDEECKRICDKIISFKKDEDIYYLIAKGNCYAALRDYKTALKYLKKAEKNVKNDPNLYNVIGQYYYNLEDYKKALKSFLHAKDLGYRSCHIDYNLANVYNFLKDEKNATDYTYKAIEQDSDDADGNYRKGWALAVLRKYNEALGYFLESEKLGCKFYRLFDTLANIYNSKNNYKKTIKYANKSIKQSPKSYYSYYSKGWAFYQLEQYDKAQKCLLKAETSGCRYCDMFAKLAYIYSKNKDNRTALIYANKALLIDSKDGFANYRKGWTLYSLDRYDDASEYLLKAEEYDYISPDLFSKIAYIYAKNGDYNLAMRYADKVLLLDSKNAYSNYLKGGLLFYSENHSEALKYLLKAKELGYEDSALDELIWDLRHTPK